ncbi:hypothetical protein [Serratia proteamaculans]|uniref:Lipoprotein n=1 Tax=Serratia proteamaculans TaxID=28151 RepID=A0A5Q2VKU4_SERPR|nr:hypothetical protein [Serratia proteamaculans]QGH64141.1 hypothetical protein GHV41_26185 [Serratia proteamaculans]
MKKASTVLLISFLLTGCGYQYDRARDRESANTLQQKRDVLLKWSPSEVKNRSIDDPINVYEARRNYIGSGEESDRFLSELISSCYNSTSDVCAYNYYANAAKKEGEEYREKQSKVAGEYSDFLIEERNKKTKVKKGDLFYCKVSINPVAEPTDSGMRVDVKDNVENVELVFSSGYKFMSPELKITEPASGLRTGVSNDGSNMFIATYDGNQYVINTYDKYILRQFTGKVLIDTEQREQVGRIIAYDCHKNK